MTEVVFEIRVRADGFSAKRDGELLADSRSGADLLSVFNQIVDIAGPGYKVVEFRKK